MSARGSNSAVFINKYRYPTVSKHGATLSTTERIIIKKIFEEWKKVRDCPLRNHALGRLSNILNKNKLERS